MPMRTHVTKMPICGFKQCAFLRFDLKYLASRRHTNQLIWWQKHKWRTYRHNNYREKTTSTIRDSLSSHGKSQKKLFVCWRTPPRNALFVYSQNVESPHEWSALRRDLSRFTCYCFSSMEWVLAWERSRFLVFLRLSYFLGWWKPNSIDETRAEK